MNERIEHNLKQALDEARDRGLSMGRPSREAFAENEARHAQEATIGLLAEEIYLRVLVDAKFETWPLKRWAEYAKHAARVFHGADE